MDIISYVLGSSRTFSELPFNEVDSLVLAQFSYAKLEAVDQAAGRRWRSGARILHGRILRQGFLRCDNR